MNMPKTTVLYKPETSHESKHYLIIYLNAMNNKAAVCIYLKNKKDHPIKYKN